VSENELKNAVATIREYVGATLVFQCDDLEAKVGNRLRALAGDLSGYNAKLDAAFAAIEAGVVEIKRLQALTKELLDNRERLETMAEDYPMGLPERRMADDLLDAIGTYEAAEAAGGEA